MQSKSSLETFFKYGAPPGHLFYFTFPGIWVFWSPLTLGSTQPFWKEGQQHLSYGIIYGIFITKATDLHSKVSRGLGCCLDVLGSGNKTFIEMKKYALKHCSFCSPSNYTNHFFKKIILQLEKLNFIKKKGFTQGWLVSRLMNWPYFLGVEGVQGTWDFQF